jgi:serine/threonine protein kinase
VIDWANVDRICDAAADKPAADRDVYLAEVCTGQPDLLACVKKYLNLQEVEPDRSLESRLGQLLTTPFFVGEEVGEEVGEGKRYTVQAEIGRGGMGVVYRAKDRTLGRTVALKVIRADILASSKVRQRFKGEAKKLAQFENPQFLRVHDWVEWKGPPFIVMAYIEGHSLHARQPRVVDPMQAADWVKQMAAAMHDAHILGIFHCDLKPENVMMKRGKEPVITDFGIAKWVAEELPSAEPGPGGGHLKVTDWIGTPQYMAPEQWVRDSTIGASADIYALGAVLHDLLTGEPPFQPTASTVDEMRIEYENSTAILANDPGQVPHDLAAICLKCLHRAARERYHSAKALADDLQRYLDRHRKRPLVQRQRLLVRRLRLAVAAAAIVLAVAVLVLTGFRFEAAVSRHVSEILNRQEDASLQPAVDNLRSSSFPFIATVTARRLRAELKNDSENSVAQIRRRATAAAGLAMLGDLSEILPHLRYGPDPRLRYHLIRALATAEVDPQDFAAKLAPMLENPEEIDAGVRQALILFFGLFDSETVRSQEERLVPHPRSLPPVLKEQLDKGLAQAYQADPDPGVHSACEWTLRRWGRCLTSLDEALQEGRSEAKMLELRHKGDTSWRWYVADHGHTMVIVDQLDSPHVYAISTKEVTVKQFENHHKLPGKQVEPTGAVKGVSWRDAYGYCGSLTTSTSKPGRPFFKSVDQIDPGIAPRALAGYRLPEVGEWVAACKSGTATPWFFGDDQTMMGWFAWIKENEGAYANNGEYEGHPVGLLMPNQLGLFDCLGNVAEICFSGSSVARGFPATVRGGCYLDLPQDFCAEVVCPHDRDGGDSDGFRVARTIDPPGS